MAIAVGNKVRCSAYKDWYGTSLASFVRTTVYDVIQIGGGSLPQERVVIGFLNPYAVTAAVDVKYLELVTISAKPTVTEQIDPAPKEEPDVSLNYDPDGETDPELRSPITSTNNNEIPSALNGSTIQTIEGRKDAGESGYNETYSISETITIDKNTENETLTNEAEQKDYYLGSYPDDYYDYGETYIDPETGQELPVDRLTKTQVFVEKVERNEAEIIQNDAGFPPQLGWDTNISGYRYDYRMRYDVDTLNDANGTKINADINNLYQSINIDIRSRHDLRNKNFNSYNRHKVQNPNDLLTKSFAHVFFIRPDCNLFASAGNPVSNIAPELVKSVAMSTEYYYALKHSPDLLRQLVQDDANYSHEFSMFLSNYARTFEISDEYISNDEYSAALTGHKIPFGRHNIESKTAGKFTVKYQDNRDLFVYNLHKLWIDYISNVYRGKFYPKIDYIMNKIIDYTTCVYYILCAEDGETVIFWSKYWGVFPLNAPSSNFSFNFDSRETMNLPELNIEYMYAYKEDFNPLALIEFNSHSTESFEYVNTYQKNKLGVGYTWSGAPYVETFYDASLGKPYTFKLRFRPEISSSSGSGGEVSLSLN